MSKWLEIREFKFQYWRQPKAKSNILCCCCCYWWWYTAKQPRCTARTALLAAVTVEASEASEASGGVTAWCQLMAMQLWSFHPKETEIELELKCLKRPYSESNVWCFPLCHRRLTWKLEKNIYESNIVKLQALDNKSG